MTAKSKIKGGDIFYRAPGISRPEAYTSPWYDALFSEWIFYRDSVKGGDAYLTRNIFMHSKESRKFFNKRLERAVFPNHARSIVSTYAAQVFKSVISRDGDDEILTAFWGDVDGAGTKANSFFKKVYKKAHTFGHCFVNVSRMDPDLDAVSFADQTAAGMRPFARIVSPLDLVDWSLDSKSRFEWAVIQEARSGDRKFNEAYTETKYQYRLWTKDSWTLYYIEESDDSSKNKSIRYVEQDTGENPLGEVPLYGVYIGDRDESNQPVSESLLKDIAPQVRRIANLISLIDEQVYQHVFNLLVVPEEIWDSLAEQDFSVAGALPRPRESQPYEYLAPDVSQINVLQEQVEATESSIRFLSGLGRVNESSKAAQSAKALAFQNTDKKALVESAASEMANLEILCAKAAMMWMNKSPEGIDVRYDIQLDPGQVESALIDALSYDSLDISGKAATQNIIQATRAHLGRYLPQEDLDEVILDIEERAAGALNEEPLAIKKQIDILENKNNSKDQSEDQTGSPPTAG